MGMAARYARRAATGSAAGACCAKMTLEYTAGFWARRSDEGKSWASKAPPANAAESRNIARREARFVRRELEFILIRPFDLRFSSNGRVTKYTAFARQTAPQVG